MQQTNLKTKKRSYKSCFTIILILIFIIIGSVLFANSWYTDKIYNANSSSTETVKFNVDAGETLVNLSTRLESEGLIKSKDALRVYLRLNNVSPAIKAGSYEIPRNLTVLEIIEMLEKGVFKKGIRVTLKEGLRHETISEILSANLSNATLYKSEEFLSIIENPDRYTFSSDVQLFLNRYKPNGKSLEGFLYPDTYEFGTDQSTLQMIDKMVLNFSEKVTADIDLNNLSLTQDKVTSLYEALTLASIIEREASAQDDRAEISGIFHNRLANGIALESDATVNYVTGENEPGVDLIDTKIDSPYNTYKYPGLTPTPIDNPRIESIVAAFYPKKSEFYFFFHTDEGETFFSKTYNEHLEKVCRLRGC